MPFSQQSGVLEWCSGTMPIAEFLVDTNKGAHKRFRPQDWTTLCCRKKMMVVFGRIQHWMMFVGWNAALTSTKWPQTVYQNRVLMPLICFTAVAAGGSEARIWRKAPGLQRGVQELQTCFQVLQHGAVPGPRGVVGETAGIHSQRGHLLYRYILRVLL